MSQQPPQQQQQYYAPPPGAPPQGQQGQYPPPPGQPGQQQQYHQQPQQPQQQQPQQHHQQQQHHHQQQQQQHGAAPASASTTQSDSGSFNGGQYTVAHRDTNAILNVNLAQGASIKSKSGAMVHMSGTVQISGKAKFSVRKLISGGDMHESTYVGPGSLALGPTLFGDIITLHVDGRTNWNVGKDAYLASTPEVGKEAKSQGVGKALFSGEDLFVYKVFGQGLMWLTSFGAVDRLDVRPLIPPPYPFFSWFT